MIKIENVEVVGWEHAIRGMRNPMNSWDKSDSFICKGGYDFDDCKGHHEECIRHEDFSEDVFCVGKNDYDLMKRLSKAGTDHRKFMRMIVVYADVTAPLYWWAECDTYKVGTVRNSCSKMHKIQYKEFTREDFSFENVPENYCWFLNEGDLIEDILMALNDAREDFLETKDKKYWWQMIQLLPSSYNQRSTVMFNYEVLANMYHSRKTHKLDEWCDFCKWIETLPYSELITGGVDNASNNITE